MDTIIQSLYELKFIIVPEGIFNQEQLTLIKGKKVDGLILSGWPTFPQQETFGSLEQPQHSPAKTT